MSSMGTGLRCFVASLAILSLAGHLSAVPLAAGVSCQNNNPFIKIMKDQGVELYSQPKQVSSICSNEFNVYGTCCEASRLIPFATRDGEIIQRAQARLVKEYVQFAGVVHKIADQIMDIASTPPPTTNRPIAIMIENAQTLIEDPRFQAFYYKNSQIQFKSRESFAKMNQKCWSTLMQARNMSICATCSGRSSHFFEQDKMLISEQTCSELSAACKEPVEALVDFIEVLESSIDLRRLINDSGMRVNFKSKLYTIHIQRFFMFFRSQDIRTTIAATKGPDSQNTATAYKFLCNSFVKLRDRVMAQEMVAIFSRDVEWELGITPLLKLYMDKQNRPDVSAKDRFWQKFKNASQKNTWKVGSRLLQFGEISAKKSLEADARIIDYHDPSYTSVGVSGHGPLETGTTFP